ncbi:MAG: hypothetical protein K9I85_07465 [Saprospiraceae bacterium]|nr:hypothetical protein [Saprospiraceae bacterium]
MKHALPLLLLLMAFLSCTKDNVLIPDNQPPNYEGIPLIKIQNFVNRLFIDLLAREPLDPEMDAFVQELQLAKLAPETRLIQVIRLQTDTAFIVGDTSYHRAYIQNLYNQAKARTLEGVSDGDIKGDAGIFLNGAYKDSLAGNWEGYTKNMKAAERLLTVIRGRSEFQSEQITYDRLFARCVNNSIYDKINMNTVNFVNATFDNLLWRYPTKSELLEGFNMIEYNLPGTIFGKQGTNKDDYVEILTNSREMFEGLIIWSYQQLLARRPTSEETGVLLQDFAGHRDIRLIQQQILITDEYANF